MRAIPLAAVPNQQLTATIDNVRYDLSLKVARGVLACTISIDGVLIISGSRVLAGEMLIPYRYMENGNFIMTTVNNELPDWPQLGTTQQLYFFSPAELGLLRG